jgi:hypothetical protein
MPRAGVACVAASAVGRHGQASIERSPNEAIAAALVPSLPRCSSNRLLRGATEGENLAQARWETEDSGVRARDRGLAPTARITRQR